LIFRCLPPLFCRVTFVACPVNIAGYQDKESDKRLREKKT
jgi:hypothetical protein